MKIIRFATAIGILGVALPAISLGQPPTGNGAGNRTPQADEGVKPVIELLIDSDNNNSFGLPDGSEWERELKNHDFAIGKLIEVGARDFIPLVIRVNELALKKELAEFGEIEDCRITFTLFEPLGEIAIWSTPAKRLDSMQVKTNEHYSLRELNYDSATSQVIVYIEAVKAAPYTATKDDIDRRGRPEMFLSVQITVFRNADDFEGKLFNDKVKYLPVEQGSFYPSYVTPENRHFRDAIAASLVNGRQSFDGTHFAVKPRESKDFGLRLVREDELFGERIADAPDAFRQMKFLDTLYNRMYNVFKSQDFLGVDGLRIALYRDYNSGQHTLAFQNDLTDTLVKFYTIAPRRRAIRLNSGIHLRQQAGILAFFLQGFLDSQQLALKDLHLTGVGTGGELAIFAALSSGIKTNVFNTQSFPAHLADIVLTVQAAPGSDEYKEYIPGSLRRVGEVSEVVQGYTVSELPFQIAPSEFNLAKGE